MTKREAQILEWIKENPMISQQEIADRANITRTSVGVHISNLMKKGEIVGKQYILRNNKYVCVIGGANIDIIGTPKAGLSKNDSSPGKISKSLGGVARNIAENLSKLDIKVELMTVLGDDDYSNLIQQNCRENNISILNSQILPNSKTSTYICINDENGEMQYAISDMEIYEKLNEDYLSRKLNIINNASACVVDTNIPEKSLEYIMDNVKCPIFLDTVSNKKTEKVCNKLRNIYTIKPNINEAEILSGVNINNIDDLDLIYKKLLSKGIERVFISMGNKGVYYSDKDNRGIISPCKNVKVVNTTGAGDTFVAALVWAYMNNYSIEYSAKAGIAASSICVASKGTVSQEISPDKIKNIIESEWR